VSVNPSDVRRLIRIATERTGDPVYDDDLAQEASLRALDAFRRAGHVHHPRAFLKKIVCDTVRDHWRRRRPPEDLESVDERFVCVKPDLDDEIDRERRLCRLRAAMQRLSASRRQVIEMYYMQDLSIAEIAAEQHRTRSAVKMDLLRARRQLAKFMGKEEK